MATINAITDIRSVDLSRFREEAQRAQHRIIAKLIEQWETGENTFGKRHERFWGYFIGDELVGIGGINEDPYLKQPAYGRMRHLWVLEPFRRNGIGRALVSQAEAFAKQHYEWMTLRTPADGSADAFYAKLGFQRCDWLDSVSHVKSVRNGAQSSTRPCPQPS